MIVITSWYLKEKVSLYWLNIIEVMIIKRQRTSLYHADHTLECSIVAFSLKVPTADSAYDPARSNSLSDRRDSERSYDDYGKMKTKQGKIALLCALGRIDCFG